QTFNIFRNYEENHPESALGKPPVRERQKEYDFTPKGKIKFEVPETSKAQSVLPFVEEDALIHGAQMDINRVTDVNEMIAANNFPAAEYLLGRKLTADELREKLVRDLLKP